MTSPDIFPSLFSDLPRLSQIEHHAAIGSTNDRARELAARGTPEIALVVADEQRAGRGRQGRAWYTPPGTALAFSLLTRPAIAARHAMRLTMLAGLAAVEGIEQATGLRLDLKWPNDVVAMTNGQLPMINVQLSMIDAQLPMIDEDAPTASGQRPAANNQPPAMRKIGGILTECAFQGDTIEYAVLGMGLNVNVDFAQQAELRESATSLRQLAGREIDRWAVLQAVVTAFVARSEWLADEQADRLHGAWAARLINLRRQIRVSLDDRIIEGYAEGVADDGALLLRSAGDRLHRLLSGDVTLHDLNL